MSDEWHYADAKGVVGPMSLAALRETLGNMSNWQRVLVWREGLPNWKEAVAVPEVRPNRVPPPLPGVGPKRDAILDEALRGLVGKAAVDVMPEAKEERSGGIDDYGANLFSQYRQLTPTITVWIKLVAFTIAIVVTDRLLQQNRFQGVWGWGAVALGIVAYVLAKAVIAVLIGYWWGRQDAKNRNRT